MLYTCLKRGLCILMLGMFSLTTTHAAPVVYSGNDGKKKKTITLTTSHGLVVKQRKPNMYVRFFNKVYNKYANKPVPRGKELPTIRTTHKSHLYHTK